MRARYREVEAYLLGVASLLERHGVVLRDPADGEDLVIREDPTGALSFALVGDLPDAPGAAPAEIAIREQFRPVGPDQYERTGYAHELLDRPRDCRRALHLHSPEWFEREFLVVVHEHCERPIGRSACDHYEGSPVGDAYAGVLALMAIWVGDVPDCSALRCLG
jgi:hypothetical protein